jgi:hypothetical protein
MTTLTAVFDGEALRPDGPVDLVLNRRYRVHLEPADGPDVSGTESAWDVLAQLEGSIEGPTDWALEHDHYLYGSPKIGTVRPASDPRSEA